MLSIIRRPAPGIANTVSVITAPPIRVPMLSPNRVTVEISALRSTWRAITIRGRRPLARAKSTYSAPSTSMIEARRLRISTADRLSARVSAGRNRW